MFDKNVTKYIKIGEREIILGQDARTKEWYCKELPCKNSQDADAQIGEINKVCNKYNTVKKENTPTPPKEKKPKVKGLE